MDWNDSCDESEDILEILEKDLPPGAVTCFVDAPLLAKDISLPKALCITLLLEPKAGCTRRGYSAESPPPRAGDFCGRETFFGSLLQPSSTRVHADCALEGRLLRFVLPRNHYCIRKRTSRKVNCMTLK